MHEMARGFLVRPLHPRPTNPLQQDVSPRPATFSSKGFSPSSDLLHLQKYPQLYSFPAVFPISPVSTPCLYYPHTRHFSLPDFQNPPADAGDLNLATNWQQPRIDLVNAFIRQQNVMTNSAGKASVNHANRQHAANTEPDKSKLKGRYVKNQVDLGDIIKEFGVEVEAKMAKLW